ELKEIGSDTVSQFIAKVSQAVSSTHPKMGKNFFRTATTVPHGRPIKFSYLSNSSALQLGLLRHTRTTLDAQNLQLRLWELLNVRNVDSERKTALIVKVPDIEALDLSRKRIATLQDWLYQLTEEGDRNNIRVKDVKSNAEAAHSVIDI